MSVHTTIRRVTPNDHEVSPGPVPSTVGWRQGATRRMLARLACVLELRAPAYTAGDPSPAAPASTCFRTHTAKVGFSVPRMALPLYHADLP